MYAHERSLVKKMQGRPFVLLGVNNDKDIATIRHAIESNNLNWRSFYDGARGPIVRKFGIQAFPTIMLIDHTGVIVHSNVRLRNKPLDREIERLVNAAESSGIATSGVPSERRKFIDESGNFSVVATAIKRNGDEIVLRKDDGSEIHVEMARLSANDQKYLKLIGLWGPEAGDHKAESAGDLEENAGGEVGDSFRMFQDSTGKFQVDAKFLEMAGEEVVLEKRDGSTIRVPVKRLSEKDKEYLRGLQ